MEHDKKTRQRWKTIFSKVTTERAAWPIDQKLVRWELDPTEGTHYFVVFFITNDCSSLISLLQF
jgi:hypothetical protein